VLDLCVRIPKSECLVCYQLDEKRRRSRPSVDAAAALRKEEQNADMITESDDGQQLESRLQGERVQQGC
jgi:hypothetical protein